MSLDCNKTLDYMVGFNKMCESFEDSCGSCPLSSIGCGTDSITQEHIDIVQEWSDEHREKTNAEVFHDMFPYADTYDICPNKIDTRGDCPNGICEDCKRWFWNKAYKMSDECFWNSAYKKEDCHSNTQQVNTSEHHSVCDNCVYNPPSSGDGKPCTLCPAQSRYDDE